MSLNNIGSEMYGLIADLFPLCRSMTGDGVRATLKILQQKIPLEIHEVPTGTEVLDWTVPQEWRIRDAYIKDAAGRRVVDFQQSNLHLVSGSAPITKIMRWSELTGHLHTLPEHPDWIPYRTCFHREGWGFCLSHRQFLELESQGDQQYEVCIDSELFDGSLTYGELYLPGKSQEEVLISCHVCHPSLANDNLSGIAVATFLADHLRLETRRYSYRFLFIPATIGAITWLSLNRSQTDLIRYGLVLALLGDAGNITYKKSRQGNAKIDRIVQRVLAQSGDPHSVVGFEPFGYDERQFCSPGFDLPMGCLMRSPNEQYPEYHTSADDLNLVQPQFLEDSLAKCLAITAALESNRTYRNLKPHGEPQLGRHGLYRAFGCSDDQARLQRATLWVLNLSDGRHSLSEIAERSGFSLMDIKRATELLLEHRLLEETPVQSRPDLYDQNVKESTRMELHKSPTAPV